MGRVNTHHSDFRSGLQVTAPEQQEGAAGFQKFQNGRVSDGSLKRRGGFVRVGHLVPTIQCGDFDGVDDYVSFPHDSRIWTLSAMPEWTLEGLHKATSYAAVRTIFARNTGTANNVDVKVYMDSTSSGRLVAELKDSAGATTTLAVTGIAAGTLVGWQLLKAVSGTYTLKANAGSASGTLGSGTLKVNTADAFAIGRANGAGTFHLGTIDYIRLFNYTKTNMDDTYCRLLNSYARGVLADYVIEKDANSDIPDRSPFGITGTVNGTLATTATTLAVNPAPIQLIQSNLTRQNARQLVVVAGGRQYEADIS